MSYAQGKQHTASPSNATQGRHPNPTPIPVHCRFYRQGRCVRGDKCRNLHVVAITSPGNAPGGAQAGAGGAASASGSGGQRGPNHKPNEVSKLPQSDTPAARPAPPNPAIAHGATGSAQNEAGGGASTSGTGKTRGTRGGRRGKNAASKAPHQPGGSAAPAPAVNNSQVQASSSTTTPASALKPCFAWRDGNCNRGDQCKYRHDPKVREDAIRRQQEAAKRAGEQRAREEEQRRIQQQREAEERRLKQQQEAQERQRQELERQRLQVEAALREEQERRQRQEQARREQEERQRQEKERQRQERERQRQEKERQRRAKEEQERLARDKAQRERLQREATTTLQLVVGGSNLVTFGAGFSLDSLIPGFDLCAVIVRNLTPRTRREQVARIFAHEFELAPARFHVAELKFEQQGKQKAVVLTRTADSQTIEDGALEGIELDGELLEFELGANALWGKMNAATSANSANDANTLTVHWNKPAKAMVATYETMEEAQRKARELDRRVVQGRRVKAVMNTPHAGVRNFVASSVKITGLDPSTSSADLYSVAGTTNIREIKSANYDYDSCLRILEQRLTAYGAASVQVMPLDGTRVQAKARFTSYETAERVHGYIEAGLFGRNPWYRAILPRGHEYVISIGRPQYDAQKPLWDDLAEGSRGRDKKKAFVRINESNKNGRMFITVLGSDQKEVGALKVRVESLVVGERLGSGYWHSSFLGGEANAFFSRARTTSKAFISVDRKVHAVRLFGTNDAKQEAKTMIEEEVERLNFLEWSIPLQKHSVSFFVRFGLKTLQDALGEENATLDLASRPVTIKIKGGDDARHQLRKLMDEAVTGKGLPVVSEEAREGGEGEICPICYDEVNIPDRLHCGHTYCEACLRHYLQSACDSKTFPLACMGAEATCGQPIAIPVIQRYLTPQRFNQLVDVAFLAYLEANARTYKYCTTPDCTQIYQRSPSTAGTAAAQAHQCPSCFSKICAGCDEEAHQGMSCDEARLHRNPAEQERLNEEWAARNNIKKCPNCRVMIEKTMGCNHISCRCGAHVCWRCLGVFDAAEIYTHMRTVHGGIHEPDPPVQPQPAAAVRNVFQQPPVAARPAVVAANDARARQEAEDRRLAELLNRQELDRQRGIWAANWNLRNAEQERVERERAQQALQARLRARELEEQRRREMAAEFARTQERVRQEQERRRREGSWCVVM